MDDEFEKTMDGEFEQPTEGEEVTGDDTNDESQAAAKQTPQPGEGESSEGEEPTVKDLSEQLDTLRKESDGRLRDLRSERNKRQELETKVNTVTDMISKARDARTSQGEEADTSEESLQVGKKRIPVSFDDDGNPFIDAEELQGLSATEVQSAKQELGQRMDGLEQNTAQVAREKYYTDAVKGVMAQDAAYPAAYKQLFDAFTMLGKGLDETIERQGLGEVKSIDHALAIIESDPTLMKNFKANYPSIEIDTVVEALSLTPDGRVNTRKLQRALSALKSSGPEETGDTGDGGEEGKKGIGKTLKAMTKARNLAGASNQKGSRETSLDDMAAMDVEDFMHLSDAEVAELERTLRDQEEAG